MRAAAILGWPVAKWSLLGSTSNDERQRNATIVRRYDSGACWSECCPWLPKRGTTMQRFAHTRTELRRASVHTIRAALLAFALVTPALSQTTTPAISSPVSLSGPRFGVTFLSDSIVSKLAEDDGIDVTSFVTQFGWQFERQFHTSENGPSLVTEWVLLVGGVEQGVFFPSVSWLVGMRTMKGIEFGVGPNVTPLGAALAAAAGISFRAGRLNIPINLAVVPSKMTRYSRGGPPSFTLIESRESGMRVSLLAGFNTRQ
jgi:hypothetical protein